MTTHDNSKILRTNKFNTLEVLFESMTDYNEGVISKRSWIQYYFEKGGYGFMAQSRKDARGRVLRKGEVQRKQDNRYIYTYVNPLGKRKFVYATDLMTLREKEKELMRDQLDGLDRYAAGKSSVNDLFDRYMATKRNLRDTTKSTYVYMYDHFVRDTFGQKKLLGIKYSDVLQFYLYLLNDKELKISTLDSIHCLLHPAFQLAVRDDLLRKNPTEGVMKELTKRTGMHRGVRHALTVDEQRVFMEYISNSPVYVHWWPLFTVLLGTGCRIGEAIGLRWKDINFKNKTISINHTITYYPTSKDRECVYKYHEPKTESGIRTIPILDVVNDAFDILKEDEIDNGPNEQVIDGHSGFIFQNRYGKIPNPQTVNGAIKRIISSYNDGEIITAKKEGREPLLLPDFSCHHLRHTFATRLCEAETNLKVIQAIMGHKNIETTMDIYAEATDRKKTEAFEHLASKLDNLF